MLALKPTMGKEYGYFISRQINALVKTELDIANELAKAKDSFRHVSSEEVDLCKLKAPVTKPLNQRCSGS